MHQGALIHINGADPILRVRACCTGTDAQNRVCLRGSLEGTPSEGGFDPLPGTPRGGPPRGARGVKLAPPGDGGHLTDFVAN